MPALNPDNPGKSQVIMQDMSTWEMLLLGVMVVLVLFWVGPGIRATLEKSRQAESRDWTGLLLPIAVVILFVLFLISSVRS